MSKTLKFHLDDKTQNRLEWLDDENDTTVSGMIQQILDEYFEYNAVEPSMVADLFQTSLQLLMVDQPIKPDGLTDTKPKNHDQLPPSK